MILCRAELQQSFVSTLCSGGVEALTAVMGVESEPVLAGAALQALTSLAASDSTRPAVLRSASLLPTITRCLQPGGRPFVFSRLHGNICVISIRVLGI